MAVYYIATGNGFAGNAQALTGTYKEGIAITGVTAGNLYNISFKYRSDDALAIYSGDYSDNHQVVNFPASIPANTDSAKTWTGEFLCVNSTDNFIGFTGNGGYMEIDELIVRPIPNLVSNGTFDSDTIWTKEAGWTINGGIATKVNDGGTGRITQPISLVPNKKYRVIFTISNYVSGTIYAQLNGGGGGGGTSRSANGIYTEDISAGTSSVGTFYFLVSSSFAGSIDNVHIYEIGDYSSFGNHTSQVTTADKYAGTSSLTVISTGAGRGSELVVNGGFDTDTTWQKQTGWTISGGKGVGTSVGSGFGIYQSISLTSGASYSMTYTIDSISNGSVRIYLAGSNQYGISRSVAGTYTEVIVANAGVTQFHIIGSGTTNVTIDNVSVRQVLGEVSLPAASMDTLVSGNKYTLEGWAKVDPASLSYGSNLITGDNSTFESGYGTWWVNSGTLSVGSFGGSGNSLRLVGDAVLPSRVKFSFTTVIGKAYKVSFNYKVDTVIGTILRIGTTNEGSDNYSITFTPPDTAWNSYSFYFVATSTTSYFMFYPAATSIISYLDNFAVVEATVLTLTNQVGSKLISITPSISTYSKFVLNFEAGAGEIGQDIKMYLDGAGRVFVDNLSITQAYDLGIALKELHTNALLETDYILATGAGGGGAGWSLYRATSNTFNFAFADSASNIKTATTTDNSPFKILKVTGKIDRTGINEILKDGSGSSTTHALTNAIGKAINYKSFDIGAWFSNPAPNDLKGLLGPIQLIRFNNIGLSDFDPTTHLIGRTPVGGGAEVVFHMDPSFDGSTFASTIKDWSPNGLTVTPTNMDITNRVTV